MYNLDCIVFAEEGLILHSISDDTRNAQHTLNKDELLAAHLVRFETTVGQDEAR